MTSRLGEQPRAVKCRLHGARIPEYMLSEGPVRAPER